MSMAAQWLVAPVPIHVAPAIQWILLVGPDRPVHSFVVVGMHMCSLCVPAFFSAICSLSGSSAESSLFGFLGEV